MTAAELLALIEPHAEALREVGWAFESTWRSKYRVEIELCPDKSLEAELIDAMLAELTLETVVMRRLEKWAFENGRYLEVSSSSDTTYARLFEPLSADFGETTDHRASHPARLGALLALWAWCREQVKK
jgi:hypothetical protein